MGVRKKIQAEAREFGAIIYNWQVIPRRGSKHSGEGCRMIRARSPRKNTKDTKKETKGREQVH